MTPQERQMLDGLFERVRSAANGPRDAEAERYIADATRSTPSAAYMLAQTVLVQQQALENAAKHIEDLEAKGGAGGEPTSFLGNLGRSLFGGGTSAPPPQQAPDPRAYNSGYAPQQRPAYAPPPPQAGPWGGAPAAPAQGGGFLSGAVQTATGVAGGMLLGNALGGLFGGHGGGLFGGGTGGGGYGRGETVNNYYTDDPAGQHAEDVLQDMDQDQDAAQDSSNFGGGGDDNA
jgi:hypothetical protein